MNYEQALKYIEGTNKFGSKLGLDNIKILLGLLDNPQDRLKVIHVAGTNGKGSTCSFINNILIGQGYNTGLYTSPFLEEFNERIQINNKNIDNDSLAKVITLVSEKIEFMVSAGFNHPTEFEIITAAAYVYFDIKKVDFVVLEVGLGGDLDATNTCNPILCAILSISLDHTDYIGNTVKEIAAVKGGIIKSGVPVVLYGQSNEVESVISSIAEKNNSKLYITKNDTVEIVNSDIEGQTINLDILEQKFNGIRMSLIGDHQGKNLMVAMTSIKILENNGMISTIDREKLLDSILSTKWAGRMELMSKKPITIIDGAHNADGAQILAETIEKYLKGKEINLVFGMLQDKDISKVANILFPKISSLTITVPNNPRAASVSQIRTVAESILDKSVAITEKPDISKAVEFSQENAKKDSVVLYAGSLYMIGEVRTILRKMDNN